MRVVDSGMLTHLQGEVTTLAACWKITRQDAVAIGFTTHTEDLTVAGFTYQAEGGTFTSSVFRATSDLAVDNLDVQAVFDSAGITEADLIAGRYDFATVEIYLVNYASPSTPPILMHYGTLGEVASQGLTFAAELRNLSQQLQQTIGRSHSRRCDADFGDTRCGFSLAGVTVTGTVATVASRQQFTVTSAPARALGKLTWTSGLNAGLSMEVKSVAGVTLALVQKMPYDITVGDAYSVYAGCDKLQSTCRDIYANLVNFQGFPFMVGPDSQYSYPDAK